MFHHYQWKDSAMSTYCLYEYFKLIDIVRDIKRTINDVSFDFRHQTYDFAIQRSVKRKFNSFLIALIDSLSVNEIIENAVRNDHAETDARRNDVVMILLDLFVSWNQLTEKVQCYKIVESIFSDNCWQIWEKTASQLDNHILYAVDNVLQLKKSQIETKFDQEQKKAAKNHAIEANLLEHEKINQIDFENSDLNVNEFMIISNAESLSHAMFFARKNWIQMNKKKCENYSVLFRIQFSFRVDDDEFDFEKDLCFVTNFSELSRSNNISFDIKIDFNEFVVRDWKNTHKMTLQTEKINDIIDVNENEIAHLMIDSINNLIDSAALQSLFNDEFQSFRFSEAFLQQTAIFFTDCKSLTDYIHVNLSLNTFQRLMIEQVLDHVISHKRRMYESKENQLLLYVRDESDVDKSRIIRALKVEFDLLKRRNELMFTVSIDCAIDNISENIIHTSLNITTRNKNMHDDQLNKVWLKRFSLIVDEINMISLELLAVMNKQLLKRKIDTFSISFFEELSLMILMKDFYQFVSIKKHSLWDKSTSSDINEHHEKSLWKKFSMMITLTEQMRQRFDNDFQILLKRAKSDKFDIENVVLLNSRTATDLFSCESFDSVVVVQFNQIKHLINRLQIERFARSRNSKIFLFSAEHFRIKKDDDDLIQNELFLEKLDENDIIESSILCYCEKMSMLLLTNQCISLSIVNDVRAIFYDVVVHSES